jgi:hypothetical protein
MAPVSNAAKNTLMALRFVFFIANRPFFAFLPLFIPFSGNGNNRSEHRAFCEWRNESLSERLLFDISPRHNFLLIAGANVTAHQRQNHDFSIIFLYFYGILENTT